MIINKKTKSILTRSDKPNENWTSQDCYVVDDNSELAKKILQNYPNIEYVVEHGKIVDAKILEAEKPNETESPVTIEERLAALEAAMLEMALGGAE